jgi:hypothetical protein
MRRTYVLSSFTPQGRVSRSLSRIHHSNREFDLASQTEKDMHKVGTSSK